MYVTEEIGAINSLNIRIAKKPWSHPEAYVWKKHNCLQERKYVFAIN